MLSILEPVMVKEGRRSAFARRLQAARRAAGLSMFALGKLSGLTRQALSRLERGEREPTWHTVQLLAGALGVSCEAFLDPAVRPPREETKPRGRPRKKR
jgi:transcriptional regulator with XRE-family HTH domain